MDLLELLTFKSSPFIVIVRQSMLFFRGPDYNVEPEFQEIVAQQKTKADSTTMSWGEQLNHYRRRLCSRVFLIPFRNVATLYAFCHFNGVGALIVYMVTIFKESGMELDSTLAPVIVCSSRIGIAFVSVVLMAKFEVIFFFILAFRLSSLFFYNFFLFANERIARKEEEFTFIVIQTIFSSEKEAVPGVQHHHRPWHAQHLRIQLRQGSSPG